MKAHLYYASGRNLEYDSYNSTLFYLSVVRAMISLYHCYEYDYDSDLTRLWDYNTGFARVIITMIKLTVLVVLFP